MLREVVMLSGCDERRAETLHREAIVVVMHDHGPVVSQVPLMVAGGVTGMVLKTDIDIDVAVPIAESRLRYEGFTVSASEALVSSLAEIEASEDAVLALCPSDIVAAREQGKAAVILGNEGGKLLEEDLALLADFYQRGLREMQLAWQVPNQLCTRQEGQGLTEFGKEVVREMNRLGMVIDGAHLPPPAFADLLELSAHPIVVSHGAVGQEQPEEQHRAMAEKGGVLGVHFFWHFVKKEGKVGIDLGDLLDQIDHAVEYLGIDHVGLGVDFFPTTGNWRPFFEGPLRGHAEWAVPDLSHLPKVTEGLVSRGYSDRDILKILGGNFLRLWEVVHQG